MLCYCFSSYNEYTHLRWYIYANGSDLIIHVLVYKVTSRSSTARAAFLAECFGYINFNRESNKKVYNSILSLTFSFRALCAPNYLHELSRLKKKFSKKESLVFLEVLIKIYIKMLREGCIILRAELSRKNIYY